MIGIKVSVPIACFRKGMAREYFETDDIPPPATCYGFLLSLVGQTERLRHLGVKVTPVLLKPSERSVILRTLWRIKSSKMSLGAGCNLSPDYQQLLIDVQLLIWLDSSEEEKPDDSPPSEWTLEERVQIALNPKRRKEIDRFGGLSFGESTHLVNDVSLYYDGTMITDKTVSADKNICPMIMCQDSKGIQTWPVWVDHVGAQGTRYVTGTLVPGGLDPPDKNTMPIIHT